MIEKIQQGITLEIIQNQLRKCAINRFYPKKIYLNPFDLKNLVKEVVTYDTFMRCIPQTIYGMEVFIDGTLTLGEVYFK